MGIDKEDYIDDDGYLRDDVKGTLIKLIEELSEVDAVNGEEDMSSRCRYCGDLIGSQRKGSDQLCNVCHKIAMDKMWNDKPKDKPVCDRCVGGYVEAIIPCSYCNMKDKPVSEMKHGCCYKCGQPWDNHEPNKCVDKPVEKCSCGVDSCDGKPPLRDLLKEKYDKPSELEDVITTWHKEWRLAYMTENEKLNLVVAIKKWVEGRLPKEKEYNYPNYIASPKKMYNKALADCRKALLGEDK